MSFRVAVLGMVVCAALAHPTGRSASPDLLSPADREVVRSGGLVTKVVETDDRTEVMSVAAIRAPMDLDRLLQYARSPLGVRRPEDSLGEGRLTTPPKAADFAALHLDERDLESLLACQVGECRVRLTADEILRLRSGAAVSAATRTQSLEGAFRAILVDEATAYLARGHVGLLAYGDGPTSIHRAEGLSELLSRPLFLLEGAPDLEAYLRTFPSAKPRLVDEFLSWRQERFWRRPVIGLFHTMIWEASNPGERRIIVATKQFYASHFYESAVELLEIRKADSDREADLTFLSRVRADIRPAGFNWLERTLIRHLVRARLEGQFEQLRARLSEPSGARREAGITPLASASPAFGGRTERRKRAGEGSPEGTPARP
jgi:hypothetical protein